MEIELKYLLTEEIARDRIFDDQHLLQMKDSDSDEIIRMQAIYFDTADGRLQQKQMAFRVRSENDRRVATLKWGGSAAEGLHVRGELNVPVDEDFLAAPHMDVFKGSEIYEELSETIGTQKMIPLMEMHYERRQMRIDTGKSISVLSLDEGSMDTERGSAPIAEIELELYSGDQEDMCSLGDELAAKYNLKPCDQSKFARGLMLLQQIPE